MSNDQKSVPVVPEVKPKQRERKALQVRKGGSREVKR